MMLWIVGAALMGQVETPRLPPKIEERVCASVVSIQNHTKAGQANGVVVEQTGNVIYVLTAAHFFDAKDRLSVTVFPSGTLVPRPQVIWEVSVVARLDKYAQDLAILRLGSMNAPKLDVLPVVAPETLPARKPFPAFSLSCSPPRGAQARAEEVLGSLPVPKLKTGKPAEFWKVKDIPEPGRSGGPLVDAEGRLLGICSAGDGKTGYYTHLSEIRRFLDDKHVFYTTEPKSKKAGE